MIDRDDPSKPSTVLLVDSSTDTVSQTQRAFERASGAATLHVVPDASACLDVLYGRGEYADTPEPNLVLLQGDALESSADADVDAVFEAITSDPERQRVPVVVCLPPTASPETVDRYYERHANAVVVLPADEEAFVDAMGRINRFWIAAARLPDRTH